MGIRIGLLLALLVLPGGTALAQGDPALIFAVVTKVPKDKSRVSARILFGGQVSDGVLIAPDGIVNNPVWRNLEICHSIKGEAWKTPEGYRLDSVRIIDSGQLPMELQGVAGDCLIRKALEVAPMVD